MKIDPETLKKVAQVSFKGNQPGIEKITRTAVQSAPRVFESVFKGLIEIGKKFFGA